MNRTHTRWLFAALAALVVAGCAQSNGDISYVQPNYVKKADLLDGVWYLRNTVTRTPATTGFTFTGEIGDLQKIVWEIQENHLVGYRAYAQFPGQDRSIEEASKPSGTTATYCFTKDGQRSCVGGHPYYGAPVVIYPIAKQFDIQRGYNPATGETTNVINENASDRPWNEREYIRVDWGNQSAEKGLFVGNFGVLNPSGSSDYSGMIYANEKGTDPYDWPRQEFTDVNGEQKLSYFEFTGRYMAQPSTIYYEGYGEIPLCYFSQSYDCTAQQIEVRTSIAKIDPNVTNDYEPLVYGPDMMNKFGFFQTERLNYDRRYGYYESNKLYLANRYRIWQHSFETGADGNIDQDKPIPAEKRIPKPIVYYVTPEARMGGQADYDEYWEAAKVLEKNWNHAFQRAVAAAWGHGNDLTGVPQMLYICPNPVPQDASADVIQNCGQPGFEARFGDLRKSFLWTVPEAVPNGLLGYGPSSKDPETGEIISANANIYTAAVARSAQGVLNVINAVSGDESIDDVIKGTDVQSYFLTHSSYASIQGKTAPLKSALTADQVTKSNEPSLGAFQKPTLKTVQLMGKLRASGGLPVVGGDKLRAAAELLKTRPDLESLIVDNPEIQQDVLSMMPQQIRDQAIADPQSAINAKRMMLLRLPEFVQIEKAKRDYFARHNICFTAEDYEDRPMTGLAFRESLWRKGEITRLIAEGKTPVEARNQADDALRKKFRQHVWRATSEHEIGHTFGLRHNFAGSFDSVNYFDPFWDLRQETLTVDQGGTPVIPRTPADLKNVSDGTETQLYGSMEDYEYSSIMDYGGKSNADWQGVGKYDEAAIIFAYSGVSDPASGNITATPGYVEVFAGSLPSEVRQFDGSDGKKFAVTGAAYDVPVVNALHTNTTVPNYTERFHYSTVPLHFGVGPDLETTIATGIENLRLRKLEKWSDVKAKEDALRALLQQNPQPNPEDVAALQVPAEVPYMFCTDEHQGRVLSCNLWDRGPDYYEMNRGWLDDYWNGYFFNHFRRDRYSFNANWAINSAYNTFEETGLVYKHWVHAMYGSSGPNSQNVPNYVNTPFGYDPIMQDTWTMATIDGINDLMKVMSTPPAGLYMLHGVDMDYDRVPDLDRWDVISEGIDYDNLSPEGEQVYRTYYTNNYKTKDNDDVSFVKIPRGEGRRMYSRYDYKSGFGFWDRMTEVGHYNDQIGAIFASVQPQADFLGVDQDADSNRYMIPYSLTFKDEMTHVYGGLWSNDEFAYDPTVTMVQDNQGNQEMKLTHQVQVKGNTYVKDFNYPAQPATAGESVNVQTTWTARIYSLYLGMAAFSVNYDLDYAKANQIIKLGGGEDVTVPTGWQKFEVEDFTTGARYAALQADNATVDTPAVKMVKDALQLKAVVDDPSKILPPQQQNNPQEIEQTRTEYTEAFRNQIRDMDIMRGMYSLYGKAF